MWLSISKSRLGLLAALLLFGAQAAHAGERMLQLVMFEQAACEWCEAWDEEIGEIYPLTAEGKRAPLRRVDIHDPRPTDLAEIPGTKFTPTFVLVAEGRELGRITGYAGEDFFWGLLAQIFDKHDKSQRGDD